MLTQLRQITNQVSVAFWRTLGGGTPVNKLIDDNWRITMANYELDSNNTNTKKPDAYANVYVEVSGDKQMQLGRYGIALDASRKLDALIIKLATENPDALAKLILSVRVTVMDESNNNDDLELVLK